MSCLALPFLFDAVEARFASEGTGVPNIFGWRAPASKAVGSTRIAWYPGDPNGALGALGPAKRIGTNPRHIGTLAELFTVEIQASDPRAPEDERKQYEATRLLFDQWWRAVYLALPGGVRVASSQWLTETKERRRGACLRVVCSVDAVIPDVALKSAPVDTGASVAVEQLDATQTISVPAPTP